MERLQLRWVALAAALSALAAAAVVAGTVTGVEALWNRATAAYVTLLPLAVGAAVLRYRLYDLDRIVSRTLAVAAAFQPARLRDQVDLDTLSAEVVAVTDLTMQPTTVSLWLRAR